MRTVAATVDKDIHVHAAGSLQRVGENGHAVEYAVGVNGGCYGENFGRAPSGIDGDGAEGVAGDIAELSAELPADLFAKDISLAMLLFEV